MLYLVICVLCVTSKWICTCIWYHGVSDIMVYGRLVVHVWAFTPLGISFQFFLHAPFYVAGHTILWAYLTSAWLLCVSCMDAVWPPSNARAKLSAWADATMEEGTAIAIPDRISEQPFTPRLSTLYAIPFGLFCILRLKNIYSVIHFQIVILSLYLSFSAQRPYRAISSSISPQWVKEGWKWVEYDRTYPGGFVGTIWPHRNCHWGPQKWLSFAPEKKKYHQRWG